MDEKEIVLEVLDFENIRNAKISDSERSLIINGNNYCKKYDKIKGFDYFIENQKIKLKTTINILKKKINLVRNSKIIKLLQNIILYNQDKQSEEISKNIINNLESYILTYKLDIFEIIKKKQEEIIKKKYVVYESNNEFVKNGFINISEDLLLNFSCEIKKKEGSKICKNLNGGILFINKKNLDLLEIDNSLKLLNNEDINSLYSIKNEIKNITIFLIDPTNQNIETFINLIKSGLENPKFIWITFSEKNMLDGCNSEILNIFSILFWSHDKVYLDENKIYCALNFENEENIKKTSNNKCEIHVEKIKYKLHQSEKSLISETTPENITLLDKLYFYNLCENIPDKQFECFECLICCENFSEKPNIKSYMPCGHSFCTDCIIKSIKIRQSCPICRKATKLNGIIIPNLKSNKMNTFLKIIKKLKNNENDEKNHKFNNIILIYVDTYTLGKILQKYLKEQNILDTLFLRENTDSSNIPKKYVICPIDKDIYTQNIKKISDIIILTSGKYMLKRESLGYDYIHNLSSIKVWVLSCLDCEILN